LRDQTTVKSIALNRRRRLSSYPHHRHEAEVRGPGPGPRTALP